MLDEQDSEIVQNEPEREQVSPFAGFMEIITQPYELGRKYIPKWFQVVAIAVLIETFCLVCGAFIISKSDGVRNETNMMFSKTLEKMENNPAFTEDKLEEMRETFEHQLDFKPVSAIGVSLAFSLVGVFFVSALYFLSARMFVEEPASYGNIMALAGYSSIITGIGALCSTMLQFVGDSTKFSLTLSFLVDPMNNPAWFAFLSRISLFSIVYYIFLGLAVAGASRMHKNWGYILFAIVFTVIVLLWGGISALSGLMM